MAKTIDYYFTTISPFAFLGHAAFVDMAKRQGCEINFKPFNLFGVWEISGAVPPMKRPPVRQRYRLVEMQRIAEMRGIDLLLKPTNFPTDPTLADHCVIAISEAGGDAGAFVQSVGEALWVKDQQIADEAVLSVLIEAAGSDASAILAAAGDEATAAKRLANTEAAIENDAIGAPAYVYNGEVFWGQDRIDLLENMIESGRSAYSAV